MTPALRASGLPHASPRASADPSPPRHVLRAALARRLAAEALAEPGKLELAQLVCDVGMPVVFDALINDAFFAALSRALQQEPLVRTDRPIGATPRRAVQFKHLDLVVVADFIENGDTWRGGMPVGLSLDVEVEEQPPRGFIHSAERTPTKELEKKYLELTSANGHPDVIRRLAFWGWQEFPELANVVLEEQLHLRRAERDAVYPHGTIIPFATCGGVGLNISL